jgi:hypothetical protein
MGRKTLHGIVASARTSGSVGASRDSLTGGIHSRASVDHPAGSNPPPATDLARREISPSEEKGATRPTDKVTLFGPLIQAREIFLEKELCYRVSDIN